MSIQIVRERQRVVSEVTELFFQHPTMERDCGYSFPCDFVGRVDVDALNPTARDSYANVRKLGWSSVVKRRVSRTSIPAVGRCECGADVVLDGDVQCTCGQWYNTFGQRVTKPLHMCEGYNDEEDA